MILADVMITDPKIKEVLPGIKSNNLELHY